MDAPPFGYYERDYPLGPVTYYKVGGPARLALFPRTVDEAVAAYHWMLRQPCRHLILGRGSNVLIADAGFSGIVLVGTGVESIATFGDHRYCIETGVDLGRLVREVMLPNNYDGVGALTGIPGSVGGAVFMNAGTVNGSTCELLETVDLATPDGRRTVAIDPGKYGYRSQTFCTASDLILRAVFRFTIAATDQRGVYQHYLRRRLDRQPQGNCCGSVFKNPANDHAARLIEACGLKGTRQGGAVISPKHANFIMNEADATCADIVGLIDLCKRRVFEQFGITLEEEVRIIT